MIKKIDFKSQISALFDTSPLHQFSKYNDFIWYSCFLAKNLANLYPYPENSKTGIAILKVQEDALKKQIEVYDQLIVQTKADIDASTPSPISQKSTSASQNSNKQLSRKIVQPQIKTPKQHSLNESISPTSQQSSIDETSARWVQIAKTRQK